MTPEDLQRLEDKIISLMDGCEHKWGAMMRFNTQECTKCKKLRGVYGEVTQLHHVLKALKPISEVGLYLGSENIFITRAKRPAPRGSMNKFDSVEWNLDQDLQEQSDELKEFLSKLLL